MDFLHGDPDQPIVTGRTYHANNLPSIGLPAAKTQMAFRSKTHKGEGFNELRFEDAKGSEGLFMHAQKDMTTMVKNDQSLTVVSPTGKSGVFNTTEVIDGKVISTSDKFRAYNDFAESADDYGRFLNKNPRYAEALKHKDDPFIFSKEVAKAGYATDPKYADKIASIIKSQGLTDYDK